MRLWSLHPSYLDVKGLVAVWREGLLAKKVLEGKTKGYTKHPQLKRFRNFEEPIIAIESYLFYIYLEAKKRGYNFDIKKLSIKAPLKKIIPVTSGQVRYEFIHLLNKLIKRDKIKYDLIKNFIKSKKLDLNPVFYLISGDIEDLERVIK